MAAKPIPDGYSSLTPYLYVPKAAEAIEFYKKAFGAEELFRLPMPDGGIAHCEIRIGNSIVMMADEMPDWGNTSPKTLGGVASSLAFYCEDCDAMFARAVKAGATVKRPLADQFYGDRSGTVADPFGHVWTLCTHKVDMTPDEMQKAMNDWMTSQGS